LLLISARALHAQTVQLPTFQSFAVSTTVVVPDSGGASLGGVTRASSGSSQFGPWGPRAIGGQGQAGGIGISVQIHDMKALDDAVLQQAAAQRARLGQPAERQALGTAAATQPPLASVADLEQRRAAGAGQRERAASELFERARSAELAGKSSVARIYYQMAARRASGDLQRQANARADALAKAMPSAGRPSR
jgi:hypothetical protein